jgi:LPS export ABC transporter protein LptC
MPPAIRLLVLDVDGVLTDGRLYFGSRGESLKVFHVRDGVGLRELQRAGLEVAVISGRRSPMVTARCRELGVRHVLQGVGDKLAAFTRLCARLKLTPAACACVGCHHASARRPRRGARGVRSPAGTQRPPGTRPMIYRLVALAALLALIVGMVLLTAPQPESVAHAATGQPLHDPGYSAQQARLIQTGADGLPVYTLDAAQIQQQPDRGLVEMRDTEGNQWTARAARGELAQGSGVVQLEGDVHVNGTLPGTGEPTEITSEHLAFDTNAQIVTTQTPVTIVMSGRELQARGLVANLKERHVHLESAVHGFFLH